MKNFMNILIAMVVVVFVASCTKEDDWLDYQSLSTNTVDRPDPIHDTIQGGNDTIIRFDTVVVDSSHNYQKNVVFGHHTYGQWAVNGSNATITATHMVKVITIVDSVMTVDSAFFTEQGNMTTVFQPSYSGSQDGTYAITNGQVPQLNATVAINWSYSHAICGGVDYSNLFEGDCELTPTSMVVNGTNATINTVHGNTSRPAAFNINVVNPDPTVVSRSVTFRHVSYGNWTGNGNTRNITATHRVIETTLWSDGSTTVDSADFSENGVMTVTFPTFNQNVDGTYTVNNGVCAQLNATVNVSWQYGTPMVQGRNYSSQFNGNCALTPTAIVINGTNATVTTAHDGISRTANFTLTVNTPVVPDSVNYFDGKMVYYAITASYSGYSGQSNVPFYVNVVTLDNGVYTWYTAQYNGSAYGMNFTNRGTITASDFAHIQSVSNFTAASQSGNRKGLALCLNSTAGASGVKSIVEYHPNGGNPQVKYRDMSGTLIGVCSAISSTINGSSVVEPVQKGGSTTSFTINGVVVY